MNNNHFFILLFSFFGIILFNSCALTSSLQTAKVLDKNEMIVGGAVYAYGTEDDEINNPTNSVVLPHIEATFRMGLGKNTDVGFKAGASGSALLEGKYQFLGDKESLFAGAIGGALELNFLNLSEVLVFRTHLPLFLSVHPNENNAIYATPRLIYQSVADDDDTAFLGGSLGFKHNFKNRLSGIIETSWYDIKHQEDYGERASIFQLGIGLVYQFKR